MVEPPYRLKYVSARLKQECFLKWEKWMEHNLTDPYSRGNSFEYRAIDICTDLLFVVFLKFSVLQPRITMQIFLLMVTNQLPK